MTIQLPEDLENSVRAEVLSGRYASEDAMVAEVVREHFQRQQPQIREAADTETARDSPRRKPLWERVAESRRTVPDEEWAKLPVDGAEQLDHSIYGSPKRSNP